MKLLFGANKLFPLKWRWAVRRVLRLSLGLMHPELDAIDFTQGSTVVLDVGANRGGFMTDLLLRAPLSQVYCFEPNPDVFSELVTNCRRVGHYKGRPRAIAENCAVGSAAGSLELRITALDVASSCLPVSAHCRSGFPDADFSLRKSVSVPVIRLEDYCRDKQLPQAKLLKIDVQGFELKVLKGCGEWLRTVEYVFTEIEFVPLYEGADLWDRVTEYLWHKGFVPVCMGGFCLGPSGVLLQADMLFRNQRLEHQSGALPLATRSS